jgi:hypothetical protein
VSIVAFDSAVKGGLIAQPPQVAMWGSQDSDNPTNTNSMDVSQSVVAVVPIDSSLESHRAGMARQSKKQDSLREFHSVPELKDYVSSSVLTYAALDSDMMAATWGLSGQGRFWLSL